MSVRDELRRLIVDLVENEVSVEANVSAANVKARGAGRNYKETGVSMSADVNRKLGSKTGKLGSEQNGTYLRPTLVVGVNSFLAQIAV